MKLWNQTVIFHVQEQKIDKIKHNYIGCKKLPPPEIKPVIKILAKVNVSPLRSTWSHCGGARYFYCRRHSLRLRLIVRTSSNHRLHFHSPLSTILLGKLVESILSTCKHHSVLYGRLYYLSFQLSLGPFW